MTKLNRQQIEEGQKNQELLPSEKDFKGMDGYWQKPAKVWRTGVGYVDGYEWGCEVSTKSKEAHEIGEAIAPFARAEDARQAGLQSSFERTEMTDQAGRTQYVASELEDQSARRNGWRPKIRWGRGKRLIRGEWYDHRGRPCDPPKSR